MKISGSEAESIVSKRIREMYDTLPGELNDSDLRAWWKNNALAALVGFDEKLVEPLVKPVDVRYLSYLQMRWSAVKVLALQRNVARNLDAFVKDNLTMEGIDEFVESLRIVLIGSLGRLESSKVGDADFNFVANVNPALRTSYANRIRANFVDGLLEGARAFLRRAAGRMGRGLEFTEIKDEDFRFIPEGELASSDRFIKDSYVNYACGYTMLHDATGKGFLPEQLPISTQDILRFLAEVRLRPDKLKEGTTKEARPRFDRNPHQAEFDWFDDNFYKVVSAGLEMLVACELRRPDEAKDCYFKLADLIIAERALGPEESKTLHAVTLLLMRFRSDPDPKKFSEGELALMQEYARDFYFIMREHFPEFVKFSPAT